MHLLTPVVERSNAIFSECFPITGQVYSDLPGPFVCASTSGMKYQMVVYDYDLKKILTRPMKICTSAEHMRSYKVMFNHLTSCEFRPKLQKLDNEASAMLKYLLTDNGVDFQLTPAGIYRHNASEQAI